MFRSTAARGVSLTIQSLRLVALAVFLTATNAGFLQRVELIVDQERWGTFIGFFGVWGLCLAALLVAAFQPHAGLRLAWALVIAATTAVAVGFRTASSTEFGVFDAISLWNARHETMRAVEFYGMSVVWMGLAFLAGLAVFVVPPPELGRHFSLWMRRAAWAPAIPTVLIAGILFIKDGGGAQALPSQFVPLSVGIVSGVTLLKNPDPTRRAIAWQPGARKVKHIVVLVDESVRGDYIDWSPGNSHTPELAGARHRVVDFGPAASGGNCSHYSNAILRLVAARKDLGGDILTNPTIWQYAKKAGFRTVFIDAQAGFVRNPGRLQNFMTVEETKDVDRLQTIDETTPPQALDDRLLDVVLQELKRDEPVFIYANKNGAHFPYDRGYPASEAPFAPTMSESAQDTMQGRINSYRNVVKWSVDRFFKRLFAEADLSETVILYTSDHGQAFVPGRLTHCSVDNPDPREALVPLFALTDDARLRTMLAAAARVQGGHASHFSIAPTALALMGYSAGDLAALGSVSLLEPRIGATSFTTGDVFGLFSATVRWHDIDLARSYLESPSAEAERTVGALAPAGER